MKLTFFIVIAAVALPFLVNTSNTTIDDPLVLNDVVDRNDLEAGNDPQVYNATVHVQTACQHLFSMSCPLVDLHDKYFGPLPSAPPCHQRAKTWPLRPQYHDLIATLTRQDPINELLSSLGALMNGSSAIKAFTAFGIETCDLTAFHMQHNDLGIPHDIAPSQTASTHFSVGTCRFVADALYHTFFLAHDASAVGMRIILVQLMSYLVEESRDVAAQTASIYTPYIFDTVCKFFQPEAIQVVREKEAALAFLSTFLLEELRPLIGQEVREKAAQVLDREGLQAAEKVLAGWVADCDGIEDGGLGEAEMLEAWRRSSDVTEQKTIRAAADHATALV